MNLPSIKSLFSRQSSAPAQKEMSPSLAAWARGDDLATGAVLSNAYQQVVWVYRAINVLAEQVANIPFLFSRGERGRESLITSGPLIDFYDRPHKRLNRFQYWETRVIWLMLRGECFRVPVYDDGQIGFSPFKNRNTRIKNILFLDPAQMHHIIEDHELVGWRYTGGRNSPLDSQLFLADEVWHERLPNPLDNWRGMPPLYVAELPAKTDFAASAFMHGLMENNADLGIIVKTDQHLTEVQQEEVLAALRNRKRKAGTADRPIVLSSGADVIKPTLSSAEMQFLENRKFSRSEICAAFGVPEEIITSTDKAKYDVMAGARLNFIENRVGPLCARLEAEETSTVRSIDPNAVGWFDIDSLPIMQEARRQRLNACTAAFQMGIPFNELNRVLDLGFKPTPWGNTGYLPKNLQPVGSINS